MPLSDGLFEFLAHPKDNNDRACQIHGDVDRGGDNADTRHRAATVAAATALNDLPLGIPKPDVCATPKGEIDLTWFVAGGTVSLSMAPDGNDIVLTAVLDDGREYSGCEPWKGRIPETMRGCLRDLLRNSS